MEPLDIILEVPLIIPLFVVVLGLEVVVLELAAVLVVDCCCCCWELVDPCCPVAVVLVFSHGLGGEADILFF